jgi:PAS domain S-box-containing protein
LQNTFKETKSEALRMSDSTKFVGDALVNDTLREMMSASEDYLFVKDINLVYHGGSKAFAHLAGLDTASGLLGKTDLDFFPRDIAEKYRADDRKLLESGEPIDGILERLPDLDGKQRWTRTWKRAIRDSGGKVLGLYGIGRDVSKEVILEEQVRTTGDCVSLISSIPCGVAIFHVQNGKFYLDFANAGFMEVHHHADMPAEALIGSDVMPYVFETDRKSLEMEYERIKSSPGIIGNADYRFTGSDDKLHWVNIRLRYAYVRDGTPYYYAAYSGLDAQKSIEEKLAESRNALREAMSNSDIQFFTYFPGQSRGEISASSKRLSELPTVWTTFPEDFLRYAQASPEDAEAYRSMIRAIDHGEDEAQCLVRLAYNGVYSWENIRIKAVRDCGGAVTRALGYSLNVTSQKNAEERLRKERVRLKTLNQGVIESFSFNLTKSSNPEVQTADKAMLEGEVNESVLKEALEICPALANTNPATREILLRAAARIPDQKDRRLFISTCSGDAVRTAISKGKYFAEIRYRRFIGSEVHWVSSSAEVLPDPESGDLIAFYYTKDIDEEVTRAVLNDEIISKNYAGVSYLDLHTGVFHVLAGTDQALWSLNGMQYADALDKAAGDFVSDVDAENYRMQLSLHTIADALREHPYYIVYNTRREVEERYLGKPLRRMKNDIFYLDGNRDKLGFLLTDVTGIFEQERGSREKLETALLAAKQASSAKSNFLSRMSHEIRTPLNAIIGMDAIAAQSIGNQEKAADCISKIGISARYLLSLINDILDMSRIESGKMLLKNQRFRFPEFISSVNNIIYPQVRAKGVDYECTVSAEVGDSYLGDEMKLQQVLVNVLGNAVKFTAKGKISLDVSVLGHESNQEKIRFIVSDTGCGIAEENLGKIFDAFEQVDTSSTTVFSGTGLGLAISKNLVGLMGGMISVRSIVGIGSEFTIDVPLTADDTPARRPRVLANLQNLYTLIVDDDLLICEQTQNILRDIGMIGEWVTNGYEAVERVQVKFDQKKYYDFILIDWKMPDMDGIETTRKIRRIVGPNVTIIIISAYDWQSIETEARAAGANLMISKPLLRSTRVSAFERALGEEKTVVHQKQEYDFTGKRVLVAEDNDLNAEIAKTLLEARHFSVDRVSNGLKALEKFVQSPEGTYDAILMDVRMPLMDGLQTTANIRHWERTDAKKIPIIAMTANAFDEDIEKSRAAGMNAHLSKPIDPELMYGTLYHLIFKAD